MALGDYWFHVQVAEFQLAYATIYSFAGAFKPFVQKKELAIRKCAFK